MSGVRHCFPGGRERTRQRGESISFPTRLLAYWADVPPVKPQIATFISAEKAQNTLRTKRAKSFQLPSTKPAEEALQAQEGKG